MVKCIRLAFKRPAEHKVLYYITYMVLKYLFGVALLIWQIIYYYIVKILFINHRCDNNVRTDKEIHLMFVKPCRCMSRA